MEYLDPPPISPEIINTLDIMNIRSNQKLGLRASRIYPRYPPPVLSNSPPPSPSKHLPYEVRVRMGTI